MPTLKETVPLLVVSDILSSSHFYTGKLGFEMTQHWEQDHRLAWCWLQWGTASLMLQQECESDPPAEERGKGVTLYFICDDATALYEEITRRSVQATKPEVSFYGMNQTYVTDPDGYLLCFENLVESQE